METFSGSNNLILTCRRRGGTVTVVQARSCDARLTIPERVWGLPVTAIGHHAFTPGRPAEDGETVRYTGGPEDGPPDNRRLRELTLPPTVTEVGDYAFYNCAALETLRLSDTVARWGGSVLMNCRALGTIHLALTGSETGAARYFADELPRELDMTLTYPGGEQARLLFPEYREVLEENCPAHHFDYTIDGGGYPYHHCFRGRTLSLTDYDLLWRDYLAAEHDPDCAMRLAWWRLRLPRDLTPEAGAAYGAYLRSRAAAVLEWLLPQRDGAALAWFLDWAEAGEAPLRAAAEQARRQGLAEAQALLLERLHRLGRGGIDKTFDL